VLRSLRMEAGERAALHAAAGETDEARALMAEVKEQFLETLDNDRHNVQALRDLIDCLAREGELELREGNWVAARRAFEEQQPLTEELLELDPDNASGQLVSAVACAGLGEALLGLSDPLEAGRRIERARVLLEELAADPANIVARRSLCRVYATLSRAHAELAEEHEQGSEAFHQQAKAAYAWADRAEAEAAQLDLRGVQSLQPAMEQLRERLSLLDRPER
jgi:hypothetical protein